MRNELETANLQLEYENRWSRLHEEMRRAGIQFLVATSRSNFEYISGYHVDHLWLSPSRVLIAVLPLDEPPVVIAPEALVDEVEASSPVTRVVASAPNSKGALEGVLAVIRATQSNPSPRRPVVGLELGREQRLNLPIQDYEYLLAAGQELEWKDASETLWAVRMIKSPYEVEMIRKVSQMTAQAFDRMFSHARTGFREIDAAAEMMKGMVDAGAGAPWFVMVTSGPGQYGRVFGKPRQRALRVGDMLWCDAGATYNGYWSDYDRAGVVGGPTKHQASTWELVRGITFDLCEKVRPGAKISSIAAECERLFELHGLPRLSGRLGHGIGLSATEPPDVAVYDETELRPGMVFTIEPAFIDDTGMYQTEVFVHVTESGYELLPYPAVELRTIPA